MTTKLQGFVIDRAKLNANNFDVILEECRTKGSPELLESCASANHG